MNLQFDMHSHILFGVDDGAQSVEDSKALVAELKKTGVKTLCLTPHFYTNKESLSDFLKRRNEAYESFKAELGNEIDVRLGAEVYVTKYLFANEEDLTSVCYEGTKYMLTEFSYQSKFSAETMRNINTLVSNYGITPVLAHVERYPYLMKHHEVLEDLIYMGVMVQTNACSLSEFRLRFKLLKMLKRGYIHLVGSDAHSLLRNSPSAFTFANELLSKKLSAEMIEEINKNSAEVLGINL